MQSSQVRVAPQLRHLNIQQILREMEAGKAALDGDAIVPLMAGGAVTNQPIFTQAANVGVAKVTAANTDGSGSGTVGTSIFKALTAGVNGTFVARVRWNPTATTPTTTAGTVGRVFYSTVGSGTTVGGSDTWLLGEVTLPAVPAGNASAPTNPIELMINQAIPSTGFIHVTNHAAPTANTAWQAMVIAGDY